MTQCGYQKVVTCTTRKPRDGEKDGVDYHFLTSEEFERLISKGAFIEFVSYNGNSYGTLKKDVEGDRKAIILEPGGVKFFLSKLTGVNRPKVIFLDVPDDVLAERMLKRGDKEEDVKKRIENDRNAGFDEIKKEADIVIHSFPIEGDFVFPF